MQIRVEELPSSRRFTLGEDCGYFPVVASVTGSDVLIVWRAGAGHMGITGRLEAVRSDDAATWAEPVVIADSEWDDRNPAVGVTRGGVIVVAYQGNGCYAGERQYETKLGRFRTRLARSRDGGKSWEQSYPLNLAEFDGLSPYGQMLTPDDGSLIMPIYGSTERKRGRGTHSSSFLLRSTDEGLTWSLHSRVGEKVNESAFLPVADGGMLGVVRSNEKDARLLSTRADSRLDWSAPADLTAPHEHPACLTALSDGTILLSYGYREKPFGARGRVSTDGGRSWRADVEIIFCDAADSWDCGYPSTIRLADGRLVAAYYTTAGAGDAWSCRGAHCHVLTYREDELLRALRR